VPWGSSGLSLCPRSSLSGLSGVRREIFPPSASAMGHISKSLEGAFLHQVNFLGPPGNFTASFILPTCPQQLHARNGLYLSAEVREVLHLAKAWEKGKEKKSLLILEVRGKIDLQENRREN